MSGRYAKGTEVSVERADQRIDDHFREVTKMVKIDSGAFYPERGEPQALLPPPRGEP